MYVIRMDAESLREAKMQVPMLMRDYRVMILLNGIRLQS
jgi:hypothetical protein